MDRPDSSIVKTVEKLGAATNDQERAQLRKTLLDQGELGAQRMFVGKDGDGNAKLVLSDPQAKPRLVLSVGKDGVARVEFLDAAGKVVRQIEP